MAQQNRFRFSTKYNDAESGLYYYGYRCCGPIRDRWLSWDPIGEPRFETPGRKGTRGVALAADLYGFLGDNPLDEFDIFGLYEYEWEGNFTDGEKKAIQDSIERVRDRANALIKQMEDNIKTLKKCPCPAYDELAKKLDGLKKILQGMVKEIDDPGWNLEIYKRSMPGRDAEYWDTPVPWFDDELRLNPSWFGQGGTDQDTTMFHEITHGQGTVDEDFSNPYNNAHVPDGSMHTDKENWVYFKFDKKNADKKCIAPGK